MPRLDPAPVDLGVDRPHGPEAAAPDPGPRRLLRLAEEGRGRAAETEAACRGELDELVRLARTEGQRLLAVDVAAGLEGTLRDLVVGVVNGQVDDDVDLPPSPGSELDGLVIIGQLLVLVVGQVRAEDERLGLGAIVVAGQTDRLSGGLQSPFVVAPGSE